MGHIKEYTKFLESHINIIITTLLVFIVRYVIASSIYANISSLMIFFMFLAIVSFPHVILEHIYSRKIENIKS